MQRPPNSHNSIPAHSNSGYDSPPFRLHYPDQQMPSQVQTAIPGHAQVQPYPTHNLTQPEEGAAVSMGRSLRQRLFIIFAFLITGIVVLSIPILALQQYIQPHIFNATSPHATTRSGITPVSTPAPKPVGKAILPLPGKILTGVSMPGDMNVIHNYEKDSGKHVSVILSYQAWGDHPNAFPDDWATPVREGGAMPMITWEPWKTAPYPQGNNESDYALKNISAGKFDTYITQWAKSAKAWRYPFFLRFAPEMNGNWTPWSEGLNGNQTGDFVKAWKHVHDIFTAHGVTNATWVWCPNIENVSDINPVSEYYPGDAYVDWTAMDGFNWGTTSQYSAWLPFAKVFGPTYNDIMKITSKPMIISETGTVERGGDKAAWITDAYSTELPDNFPNVKGIVWFNQITQQDWRIESSSAAQQAFSQAIKASHYASNTFKDYMGG